MTRYFIELRTRKNVKGFGFCHLREIYKTKMRKKLLNAATKTEVHAA